MRILLFSGGVLAINRFPSIIAAWAGLAQDRQEQAAHDRPFIRPAVNGQGCPDHACPIVQDAQAHPAGGRWSPGRKPSSVVANDQLIAITGRLEADLDMARVAIPPGGVGVPAANPVPSSRTISS